MTCVSPHGTVMTAADEPNILRLQSARTQHHTVCGFMVMDCALFSHMIGLMLSPARTARTTAMTQRVRALTAMAAGDEPNILRLWSARTQNHAVRVFMATDFEKLPTWRERAVRGMPRATTHHDRCAAAIHVHDFSNLAATWLHSDTPRASCPHFHA